MTIRRTFVHVAIAAVCVAVTMTLDSGAAQNSPPKQYTETITAKSGDKISFDMVLVPAGVFQMGSAADEPGRKDDEGPQHQVRLDSFYLCSTETTIALFMAYYQETVSAKRDLLGMQEEKKQQDGSVDAITGPTPVYGDMTMGYNEKHPAIGMTWHNAMTFCRWLSQKTGRQYRLPTEAEWEYACRAGTTNVFGVTSDAEQMKEFAWYDATADNETSEVGKKKPNVWGLYDMSGSVREWVHDFYSPTAYQEAAKQKPAVNPKGPESGQVHVARGGDYSCKVQELRCAARAFEEPYWRAGDPQIPKSQWWLPEMDIIGFRVARSVDAGDKK
jgi:formylglycine-generating enzyme required for sulfatase activity